MAMNVRNVTLTIAIAYIEGRGKIKAPKRALHKVRARLGISVIRSVR
jgi:hypothetical protein